MDFRKDNFGNIAQVGLTVKKMKMRIAPFMYMVGIFNHLLKKIMKKSNMPLHRKKFEEFGNYYT